MLMLLNVDILLYQVREQVARDLYRTMKAAESGPWIARSKRGLGVVVEGEFADVRPDRSGRLSPDGTGLSVAPDDPANLQQHRRPNWIEAPGRDGRLRFGDSTDPLWKINEEALDEDLEFLETDEDPPHGVLQPRRSMLLAEYEEALARTSDRWELIPPEGV